METRDQWYKPNLLYNIHYRPPTRIEPPKMIVETVLFNPSVCTCGEHGCEPKYRMEKRVLWTDKEIVTREQEKKKSKENEIDSNTMPKEEKNARNDAQNAEEVRVYDNDQEKLKEMEDKSDDYIGDVGNSFDIKLDKFYEKAKNGKDIVDVDNCKGEQSSGIGKSNTNLSRISDDSYGCDSADSETVNATNVHFDYDHMKYNDWKSNARQNSDSNFYLQSYTYGNEIKVFDEGNDMSDCLAGICCGNVNIDAVKPGARGNGHSRSCTAVIDIGKCAYKDHNSTDVEIRTSIGETENATNDANSVTSCSDTGIIKDDPASHKDSDECVQVTEYNETLGQIEETEDPEILKQVEEIASSFGIMAVYCNSEIHSWKMIPDRDQI